MLIETKKTKKNYSTFETWEVFEVYIGMWRSLSGHVFTIEKHGDNIVVQEFPELLSHILFTEGVFQGKIKLRI